MKTTRKGYVIISRQGSIYESSFRYLKKDCIKSFAEGSQDSWLITKNKYGWECVKAEQTIKTIES